MHSSIHSYLTTVFLVVYCEHTVLLTPNVYRKRGTYSPGFAALGANAEMAQPGLDPREGLHLIYLIHLVLTHRNEVWGQGGADLFVSTIN